MNICIACGLSTKNPKFCSQSCSAKISNKARYGTLRKPQFCRRCSQEIPRNPALDWSKDRKTICEACSLSNDTTVPDEDPRPCLRNGCSGTTGSRSQYCSRKCQNIAAVTRRRHKVKQMAVAYKGGSCELCGYNKNITALEFHHRDPAQKLFGIGHKGHCRAWKVIQAELDKCVMLCANCHREQHTI